MHWIFVQDGIQTRFDLILKRWAFRDTHAQILTFIMRLKTIGKEIETFHSSEKAGKGRHLNQIFKFSSSSAMDDLIENLCPYI